MTETETPNSKPQNAPIPIDVASTIIRPAPYRFIFRAEEPPLVDELIELREAIDALPETAQTFNPTKHLEPFTARIFQQRPMLLYLTGSWHVPGWFTGGGTSVKARFVNPNAPGIRRYSLGGGTCACGVSLTARPERQVHRHAIYCSSADRQQLNERIHARRFERILQGAHLNQDQNEIAPSVGMHRDSMTNLLARHDLSWAGLRRVGRARMAVTVMQLSKMGYTLRTLARAFGYSPSGMQSYKADGYDLIDVTE